MNNDRYHAQDRYHAHILDTQARLLERIGRIRASYEIDTTELNRLYALLGQNTFEIYFYERLPRV